MGLFSRDNQDNNSNSDFLEDVDLPSSSDLNEDVFDSNKPLGFSDQDSAPSRREPIARNTTGYSIEDAINLMRSLPRDNNEVVVTVVKKTLESTQIQVSDIIADADSKEAKIRDQHKTLETEIKELQEQIAQRNQRITDLLKDLKETTDVRQRLQLAMDLDQKNTTDAAKTNQTEAASSAISSQNEQESSEAGSSSTQTAPTQKTEAGKGSDKTPDPSAYASNPNARRRPSHRGASSQS